MRLKTWFGALVILTLVIGVWSKASAQQAPPWLCITINGSFTGCPTSTPAPTPTPTPVPTATPTPTPTPTATPNTVQYVNSWKQGSGNLGTTLTVADAPTAGDLLVAIYYTNSPSGCPAATISAGWTVQGTPACTQIKHETYVLTHVAVAGEVSATPIASLSGTAYQNLVLFDFANANTAGPIDVISANTVMSNSTTTPAAPSITTTQNGDMLISSWGTQAHVAQANTVSGGYTQIDENNSAYLSVGYLSQVASGSAAGPTITYPGTNTSGQVISLAIAPAPVNNAPTHMAIKEYWGAGTGGCAGYDSGAQALQSLFTIVEWCGGTGFPNSTLSTECATGCLPQEYVSFNQMECTNIQKEPQFYNYLDANDESGFIHILGTAHTAANRIYYNKGGTSNCPLFGQITGSAGTGPYFLYPNPGDATANTWYYNNVYLSTTLFPSNRWIAFEDNSGPEYPAFGLNGLVADEYQTVPAWRAALATHDNAMCPTAGSSSCFRMEDNSLGPGGANYEPSDSTGHIAGVVHGQIDIEDVCNNATQGNRVGFVSEDPMWSSAHGFMKGNAKVLINTASDIWSTSTCNGQYLDDLEQSVKTQSTEDQIRRVRTALDWLMLPDDSSLRVMMWTYAICQCSTESPFFPEMVVVPQQPEQKLGKWSYGGTSDYSGCPLGSTPGSGTDAGGDSGGVVSLAFACVSADAGRYGGAVYIRQFAKCAIAGVWEGKCAAVYNATSQPFTYSSVRTNGDAWSVYQHYITWTGFELPSVTILGTTYTLCASGAANCNGTGPLTTSVFSSSDTLAPGDAALLAGW